MTADPEWDYALCAPGDKELATLALALSGDRVPEVREHPYLTGLGPGEVILMRKPPFPGPPFTMPGERPFLPFGLTEPFGRLGERLLPVYEGLIGLVSGYAREQQERRERGAVMRREYQRRLKARGRRRR